MIRWPALASFSMVTSSRTERLPHGRRRRPAQVAEIAGNHDAIVVL
jgi:hypothetical protein